jgi:hypothetical protein
VSVPAREDDEVHLHALQTMIEQSQLFELRHYGLGKLHRYSEITSATIQCKTFPLLYCLKKIEYTVQNSLIFPVVLYGCESWSLTLRGEHRLRVFENRVLRRIFGPKRDEMTGH